MSTLWLPRSACGLHCLGTPSVAPLRTAVRTAARTAAFLAVLLGAVATAPLLFVLRGRARAVALRGLARAVLRSIGVRIVVRGRAPRPGSLLVANHVSWLDPLVLMAVAPARPLAKREVRGWPLVGTLVAASGALFIDRSRPRTLPATVRAVSLTLRAGDTVAAFPEGTTTCGEGGRFRPALFQAAIDAGAPVVPLAIRYDSTAAAFVGDDSLAGSVRRVAATGGLTVTLAYAPALHPEPGAGRRTLARAAQSAITPPSHLTLAA